MNKALFSILFFLLFTTAFAETVITRSITQNTTWTRQGSPYIVKASYSVSKGVTLTVEPGTQIILTGTLYINGTLVAEGTASDSIKFTGSAPGAKPAGHLFLQDGSSSSIKFASFKYMDWATFITVNTSPKISNCFYLHNTIDIKAVMTSVSNLADIDGKGIEFFSFGVPGQTAYLPKTGKCPYWINGYDIYVNQKDGLIVAPGAHLQFRGASKLEVYGMLKAEGNKSDSVFVERTADATRRVGSIAMMKDSRGSIKYVSFKGIAFPLSLSEPVTVESISIADATFGINVNTLGDQIQYLSNVTIRKCERGLTTGANSTVHLKNSFVAGNNDYGIVSSGLVVAPYCWWGHISGPMHQEKNPAGKGDRLLGNVVFDPWLHFDPTNAGAVVLTPTSGGNAGNVTVMVSGSGFTPGMRITFSGPTGIDVSNIDSLSNFVDEHRYVAVFNLRGQSAGKCDVTVEIPEKAPITLKDGFTIESGGMAQTYSQIIGFDAFREGRSQTLALTYGNQGNIDAKGVPLWLAIGDTTTKIEFSFKMIPANNQYVIKASDSTVVLDFSEIPDYFLTDSLGGRKRASRVYPLYIPIIPAGFSATLFFTLTSKGPNNIDLLTFTGKPLFINPMLENAKECLFNVAWDATDADDILEDVLELVPFAECAHYLVKDVFKFDNFEYDPKSYVAEALGVELGGDPRNLYGTGNMLWTHAAGILNCGVDLLGLGTTARLGKLIGKKASQLAEISYRKIFKINERLDDWDLDDVQESISNIYPCYEAFVESTQIYRHTMRSVRAIDPNDKLGPTGISQARFIKNQQQVSYQIRFENLKTATGAAQDVEIVDTISTESFEVASLRFTSIAIGRSIYTISDNVSYIDLTRERKLILKVELGLDTARGIAKWTLTSLDPKSYKSPADPHAGFLPPNNENGDGEGAIFFQIATHKDLKDGHKLSNSAAISFDSDTVIVTPAWLNTLDLKAPESKIIALERQLNNEPAKLRFTANDGESGVERVEIWGSKGSPTGPFKLFATSDSSFAKVSIPNDTILYFYSVAIDRVGNRETVPAVYDFDSANPVLGEPKHPKEIVIYPNPTHQSLTIAGELNDGVIAVEIVDLRGNRLRKKKTVVRGGRVELQNLFADFLPGEYILSLSQNGIKVNRKVVVAPAP